nr:immunoglobulin light chain junction region [Macaca mulatta]
DYFCMIEHGRVWVF